MNAPGTHEGGTPEHVFEKASALLLALQPWALHGEAVQSAAAELTLALAQIPEEAVVDA